ncbi:MAG: isoleucine--tRNA ligase [Longimicrobiaceae bacterium]
MSGRYPELPASAGTLEEAILRVWNEEDTFARALEQTAEGEPFVFYEGPPTANGRPGIHHVLGRTIKDAVARFRTMQGRYVPRIAGWDTHGLPVEIEAERRLGISGKPEIEEVGIARFNEVCRESVLQYTGEWERFSARIGYWLDYAHPYVTYRPEYIESVWWLLSEIAGRGLIYRGHKILPYCGRCGTGLSSHELSLGYETVRDPSLYVTLPVLGDDGEADGRELLVWTTTPWTLVSNVALAVGPELEYAEVEHDGRRYLLARSRVEPLFGADAEIARTLGADELIGLHYRRPFDWLEPVGYDAETVERGWRVYPAEWVSAEEGTGVVHTAVAFGADDYELGREVGLPIIMPVDDRGRFRDDVPLVGGQFVKDADDALVRDLKERGLVFRSSREEHSYPHCWRCGSPLIYMARDSWFIRTTAVREELLANNRAVRWHPPEIGTGRFGEWLENNVDWAISRSRYWGTPLPVWVCDADPSHLEWIGSFAALAERAGVLPDDFDPHRPGIDELHWSCTSEGCGGTMRRAPEVIDVWFDSGAMPYAQQHYPFENRDRFHRQFPADFICEAVDQTRGWFYSLLAIGTLMEDGPAFRNVIVNDLILDATGQKMSKSKGNVVDPWEALDEYGADAVRWYLLASSHPWLPKRFDAAGVGEVDRKILDTLRQTYRFFALYANLEADAPRDDARSEHPLDRWLRSRLATVTGAVIRDLEAYDLTHAIRALGDFVVDDLSNWYVRRSRERFWGSGDGADAAAFAMLRTALLTTTRLMAPFAPFLADWLHRALTGGASVHLAGFPEVVEGDGDEALEQAMDAARRLSTLGRAARERVGIRVRQPLGTLHAVVPDAVSVPPELLEILRDELNVRRVEFLDRAEEIVEFSARPDFRALGARLGKRTPRAAEAIRALPSEAIAAFRRGEPLAVEVDGGMVALGAGDFEVVQSTRGDLVVEADGPFTVALDPTLTPELKAEGLARELINRIQRLRRDAGLAVSDRIELSIAGGEEVQRTLAAHGDTVAAETLATGLHVGGDLAAGRWDVTREVDLGGVPATVALRREASEEAA